MSANERRAEIMRIMVARRQENMQVLASELGVSDRTIRNDIVALTAEYPLETYRGNGGGVRMLFDIETIELTIVQPRISHFSTWEISAEELHQWAEQEFEPKARMALDGEGEYKAGEWCRFCKARFQCRARAEEYLHLAQMEFSQPALLSDEEIAEVLSKADALKKWAEEIYTYAQNEAITNRKEWPGFKLVLGRSNRKYTDEEEVAEAAKTAGYTDIYRTSLISITEMEKLMGKKKFNEILGSYVYKPDGKVTLVPDSDKREAIYISTAEADFSQED